MKLFIKTCLLWTLSISVYGADVRNLPETQQDVVMISADRYLIKNVRLIDGSGAAAIEDQDVLIADGMISAVGPSGSLSHPATIQVIDGAGKTVMPGLVMMHEHLFYPEHGASVPNYMSEALDFSTLYLSHGVTTMRTGGSMNVTDDIAVKEMVNAGEYLGPEIHLTAPYIEGPGSFSYQMPVFEGTDQVREFVRFWAGQGVSALKAYMNIKPDVLAAAIDEAHKHGVHVTGHLCSVTYVQAAELGIDDLEHGFFAATDFAQGKIFGECPGDNAADDGFMAAGASPELAAPVFKALIDNDVYITSTLPVMAAGVRDYEPSQLGLDLMAPVARENANRFLNRYASNPDIKAGRNERLEAGFALIRSFGQAGGKIVVGTDPTGWGGTIPGPANHSALYLLAEAGFSPLEVIRIATLNGATLLGIEDRVGTIEAGKEADMILVNGKPDQNIKDIANITMVITDGLGINGNMLAAHSIGRVGR